MKKLEVAVIAFAIVMLTIVVMSEGTAAAGENGKQSFRGSIKVKRGVDYAKFAKISPRQAQQSVIMRYPKAAIKSIRLQKENGYLVYEVLLLNGGRALDVKVDAGNGKVLFIDNNTDEEGQQYENNDEEDNFGEGDNRD